MQPPLRLGKYHITGLLGEGAMGTVYRGFDPDIRREVAVKAVRDPGDGRQGAGAGQGWRFRNEAQAAGRLQHPGIVAVHEFGHDAGVDFMAMELVRGDTLARYLEQAAARGLAIHALDVLSITGQLLQALGHAHDEGVWHRDIKPANILITPGGQVKISDFGIARIVSSDHTQANGLVGTPAYMAPERLLGQPIDCRVDLYAVGVVLFQLLTGRLPFVGTTEAVLFQAVHAPPPLPSQLAGMQHLSPYDALLQQALAKRPEQRFADARQFLEALWAVAGRPHPLRVSHATVTELRPPLSAPGVAADAASTWTVPPPWLGADGMARAVHLLGRHVGPLARVLVRRTAPGCPDLPTLYARLADQISDDSARRAFQAEVATPSPDPGGFTATVRLQTWPTVPPASLPGAPGPLPSPALQEAAQRLLAHELGPIAAVLVKKALAAAPRREAFLQHLAAAVTDPVARGRLLDRFLHLPG